MQLKYIYAKLKFGPMGKISKEQNSEEDAIRFDIDPTFVSGEDADGIKYLQIWEEKIRKGGDKIENHVEKEK